MSNKTDISADTVTINGVSYVRADRVPGQKTLPGKRAIIVIDRGWIVAGDVTEDGDRIKLSRAVHVRSWESIGFDGLVEDGGKTNKVTLKAFPNGFDIPKGSEIFRVPVADDWGFRSGK